MRIPTRSLGEDGPPVGAIGLGCMGMSWAYGPGERDEATSIAVLHRAIDLGVTLIDTADAYGPFTNEELVGKGLAGRRDEVVLATKGGLVIEDAATLTYGRNADPEYLRGALDASLRRLRTDHVDLYQLHRTQDGVPIEESWGALAEAVAAGKATHIGLSEVTVEQLEVAHAIHPVASLQSELSLWTRGALDDVLPWCEEHGVAFIPFSPLGRGFLTGALAAVTFDAHDFRARNPRFTPEAMEQNVRIIETVRTVAERLDATPAQIALAWVLRQGRSVVPIPGTKRVAYLEENAGAAAVVLQAEDIAALDALPAAVGERY